MAARCFCARLPHGHDYIESACTHHEKDEQPNAERFIPVPPLNRSDAIHLKVGGCPWAGPKPGGGFTRCTKIRGHKEPHSFEETKT